MLRNINECNRNLANNGWYTWNGDNMVKYFSEGCFDPFLLGCAKFN